MIERGWFVPGRIEVLGKHTDYAGGRSLVCATEQGLRFDVSPRDDARLRMSSDKYGDLDCEIGPELATRAGDWSVYPMTVAKRIALNFPGRLRGADIRVSGDLPGAAGLSSSSAMVVGTFAALSDVNELASRPEYTANITSPEDLATYLSSIEMGGAFGALAGDAGVGTRGGSQDHTAILCCRTGELAQYAWRPVRRERDVTLPPHWAFVVAVSGVEAEKIGGALDQYNRMVRDVSGPRGQWPQGRREQFDQECALIPAVVDAIARGDLKGMGALVDRSQAIAERSLGNQIPETIFLARTARDLGAIAASAFGAGFGGSVWALVVSQGEVEGFRARWNERYRVAFPGPAVGSRFFVTRPGAGLTKL